MTSHTYQADPKYNHSSITYKSCDKITLDVDGIDISIYTQMLKPPHTIIVHLADFDSGRDPNIGSLKKERGDIFSECCT